MDPDAVLRLVEHPQIAEVAAEVRSRLRRVMKAL